MTITDNPPFEWKESFNHHPAYPGVWVPYWPHYQWRFKEWYDIKLHDGTVHCTMYPNATAWSGDSGKHFEDHEVAEIRLIPAKNHPIKWLRSPNQDYTIKHCADLFGEDVFPDVVPAGDGIAFIPRRYRFFATLVEDTNGEMVRDLWEGELTMAESKALQEGSYNGDITPTQPSS